MSIRLSGRYLLFFSIIFTSCLWAQLPEPDAPVLKPRKLIAPRVGNFDGTGELTEHRTLVGGPWMLNPNMKSTIHIRNGLETQEMVTTPVLYLSNGKRILLNDVKLRPGGTAIVDVGDSLRKLGIAPYASLRGYVELGYVSSFDPLCATVVSVDPVHSVIFTYGFRPTAPVAMTLRALHKNPPPERSTQRIDGVWWKQNRQVDAFVTLSNITDEPIRAALHSSSSDARSLGTHDLTIAPHVTSTIDLAEVINGPLTEGGIELHYTGPTEGLLINGGLEDLASGYSAAMPFRPHEETTAGENLTGAVTVLAELGLMTGAPDPMMLFPSGTEFTPFTVMRNISATSISLVPEVFWMDHSVAHRKTLHSFALAAENTVSVDVPALLKEAALQNFNGILNLTFKTKSSPAALIVSSGSVDRTNTYVFQVKPHIIKESMAKALSYWSTDGGDDTMVSIWNPADEPQDFLFTLYYDGGSYVMPLHLDARASRFLNIGSLIRDQAPDATGQLIPPTVTHGSARLTGLTADNEHILVEMDAGTYNVKKATCSYYCVSCDGVLTLVVANPLATPFGRSTYAKLMANQSNGGSYDLAQQSQWTSSNNSIATMPTNVNGAVSGVAKGTFTGNFTAPSQPIANSHYCAYDASCPDIADVYASSNGTVTDNTPVLLGISPSDWASGATTPNVLFTGQYFGSRAPSLTFSPGSGISYTLLSYNDTQITANINVASGVPTEQVYVSVTNNGYGSVGFQSGGGSVPATSSFTLASIHASFSSPDITVIGWVDRSVSDLTDTALAAAASRANTSLVTALKNNCASEVYTWSVLGFGRDISSQADKDYANTFLVSHTSNANPGPSISKTLGHWLSSDFRIYNDWGGGSSGEAIGSTPSPCPGMLSYFGSLLLGGGEQGPAFGAKGTSPTGKIYKVVQGRIGSLGQRGANSINGRSVPYIYSVVEFDSAGNPTYSDVAPFPSYSVYVNNQLVWTHPQTTVSNFVNNYDSSNVNAWSANLQ